MNIGEPKEELLDAYAQVCRELGAIQEVGPAYYRWFINLSDKQLLELLELIVLDRAKEMNAWAFAEPQTKTDQDICDYLETLLDLFGHGFLQVNADGRVGCCAPAGAKPTDAEAREIDYKTRAVRPLYREAVLNVLKTKKPQDS